MSIARGSSSSKPTVDADGFTSVSTGRAGNFGRSQSLGNFVRNDSKNNVRKSEKRGSSGGSFAALNQASKRENQKNKAKEMLPDVDEKKASITKVEYKSPEECGKKAKNYLKEYFVSGDIDDIVLSIDELVVTGAEGSVERGSKIVEGGALMVLEMKAADVEKFLTVMSACIEKKKIESASIVSGLNDPFEFLADIAIDAPLATSHLVAIVSKFIESGAIGLDILLDAPEYFRTDGGAASFACQVVKKLGDKALSSQANFDTIEKLMTDSDKELFPAGAKAMLN